jgi:hypothetical protein
MRKRGHRKVRRERKIEEKRIIFRGKTRKKIAAGETSIAKKAKTWAHRNNRDLVSVRLLVKNRYGIFPSSRAFDDETMDYYFSSTNPLWGKDGEGQWIAGISIRHATVRKPNKKKSNKPSKKSNK